MKRISFYKLILFIFSLSALFSCAQAERFSLDGPSGALITIVQKTVETSVSSAASSSGFQFSGTLQGLKSGTVQIQLNNEILPISANGGFQFANRVSQNQTYQLSVNSSASNHSCKIYSGTTENPSGNVSTDVSNLVVYCSTIVINGKIPGETIEIKEDGTALSFDVSLSGPTGPNDPVAHVSLSTTATIDHFNPGPDNYDMNFANPDSVSVTASDLTPAGASDYFDQTYALNVSVTPSNLAVSFNLKILNNDKRIAAVTRASAGNMQYGGNAFGINGGDSGCTGYAGITSKILAGVAARIPGNSDWPIAKNTKYYRADNNAFIATSDNNGLIAYNTLYNSTGVPPANFWSGFNTNWTVNANNCSDWTNSATGNGLAGDASTLIPCTTGNKYSLCIEQ
ncbi:hypothetical protein A0128_16715 [Leptospira tipperaryensis]|uniref:DUF1554 domain-containing protein n=1 Tax=Leptospira tipperaryensis TaxID=2564040 RepID=A0A1D7V0I8_9LEPT|nr:DUF1554 domain-containing protein [Leptospira tipperaryensis]AOP35337.1 hypothetical protein A0128_16715 [Leptospira tipperaryensis]